MRAPGRARPHVCPFLAEGQRDREIRESNRPQPAPDVHFGATDERLGAQRVGIEEFAVEADGEADLSLLPQSSSVRQLEHFGALGRSNLERRRDAAAAARWPAAIAISPSSWRAHSAAGCGSDERRLRRYLRRQRFHPAKLLLRSSRLDHDRGRGWVRVASRSLIPTVLAVGRFIFERQGQVGGGQVGGVFFTSVADRHD